jgi:hypothetical protein
MTQGERTYNDYDGFARDHARPNDASPFLALYERPAILALAGDVRRSRPGAGRRTVRLGTVVTAVDRSVGLLEVAVSSSARTSRSTTPTSLSRCPSRTAPTSGSAATTHFLVFSLTA